jgi:hypothetical protein
MDMTRALRLTGVLALAISLPTAAEEAGGAGLLKRAANVDKPIAETYEPLSSTYIGDGERLNQTIEQSWQLRQAARESQQRDAADAAIASPERKALEQRIQEPGLAAPADGEPRVIDTGDRLEIRGE